MTLTLSPQTITALVAIWLMSWIHLRGVGPGRLVGNVLASLKISAFVLFIVLGFAFGTGSMTNLTAVAGSPSPGSWLFALVPVLFTYAGWNAASYVAEEIRDPGRNVPRALALGTLAVVVIYLLLNALYLYVLPVGELAAVRGSVLDVIADRLLGTSAGNIMGIVSIVSLLASISAMVFAGPRVYYAMARDGMFFPAAARVHPRYRTPATSIVAQGLWSTCSCSRAAPTRSPPTPGSRSSCSTAWPWRRCSCCASASPTRRARIPTWGYPVVPGIFVVVSALIVANALWTDLVAPLTSGRAMGPSAAGLLIIGLGLPLYAWFTRTTSAAR